MHDVLTKNDLTDIFETNIEGYTKLLLEDYDESIINAQQAEIVDTLINGLPARLTTIKGTIDGLDCFLSLAFLEGEDTYYQVLAWTLADMKDRHGEHMRKMMYTFRELN